MIRRPGSWAAAGRKEAPKVTVYTSWRCGKFGVAPWSLCGLISAGRDWQGGGHFCFSRARICISRLHRLSWVPNTVASADQHNRGWRIQPPLRDLGIARRRWLGGGRLVIPQESVRHAALVLSFLGLSWARWASTASFAIFTTRNHAPLSPRRSSFSRPGKPAPTAYQ